MRLPIGLGLVLLVNGQGIGAKPMVKPATVTLEAFQFQPDELTVQVGQKVVFTNKDGTPHTVTPVVAGQFEKLGRLLTNESKMRVFTYKGTYAYFCELHTTMMGRIIVR